MNNSGKKSSKIGNKINDLIWKFINELEFYRNVFNHQSSILSLNYIFEVFSS